MQSFLKFLSLIRGADERNPAGKQRECRKQLADGYVTKSAMSTVSVVTGGYLLPPTWSDELIHGMAEESFLLSRANVFTIDTADFVAPAIDVETAQAAGTPLVGGIAFKWGFENAPAEIAEPKFRGLAFHTWDLVGYCTVSNQWLQDTWGTETDATRGYGPNTLDDRPDWNPQPQAYAAASHSHWNTGRSEPATPQGKRVPRGTGTAPANIGHVTSFQRGSADVPGDTIRGGTTNLDNRLMKMFAKAAAWYLEYAFLQGGGAAQQMPFGILNSPACYTVTRSGAGKIAASDIANMTSHLLPRSWGSAIWVCHPTALAQIQTMSQYFLNFEMSGMFRMKPKPAGALSTLPLFVSDKLPTTGTVGNRGDIMLFDPELYTVVQRPEIVIDVSPQTLWTTQQTVFRVWARADGKPELSSTVTLPDGSTTAAMAVVLSSL